MPVKRCAGINHGRKNRGGGRPCKRRPTPGSAYCSKHQAPVERTWRRAWTIEKAEALAGRWHPKFDLSLKPVRTFEDVLIHEHAEACAFLDHHDPLAADRAARQRAATKAAYAVAKTQAPAVAEPVIDDAAIEAAIAERQEQDPPATEAKVAEPVAEPTPKWDFTHWSGMQIRIVPGRDGSIDHFVFSVPRGYKGPPAPDVLRSKPFARVVDAKHPGFYELCFPADDDVGLKELERRSAGHARPFMPGDFGLDQFRR